MYSIDLNDLASLRYINLNDSPDLKNIWINNCRKVHTLLLKKVNIDDTTLLSVFSNLENLTYLSIHRN
jgi:hypothetical protein